MIVEVNSVVTAKSKGGLGVKRKLSPFNKYMVRFLDCSFCGTFLIPSTRLQRAELRRLKETKPDMPHRDRCDIQIINVTAVLLTFIGRFKAAVESWNKSKPKTA
jgi:hypothetical protein